MNISNFSIQLRELSDDYASQRIIFDDYRAKRKKILDEIDININGPDRLTKDIPAASKGSTDKVMDKFFEDFKKAED